MAAVLVLAAFTVYFAMSFITRDSALHERVRARRAGRASHERGRRQPRGRR